MTKEEIEALIVRELAIEGTAGQQTLAYGQIPEWTSASHMNVIMALEDETGLEFTPDEIVAMTNVSTIHDAITRHDAD